MINSISTYSVQYSITPDTQADEQPNTRKKRSFDQPVTQVADFDTTSNIDKPRRRSSGGLDSLGRGNLL
jgi:hypothetical protein